MWINIFLILLVLQLDVCQADLTCTPSKKYRRWSYAYKTKTEPHTADTTVILADTGAGKNHVPPEGTQTTTLRCCGLVQRWFVNWRAVGDNTMQIWRPKGNDKYLLIGEQKLFGNNGGYNVTPAEDIFVQVGDKMGFTGNQMEWRATTRYDATLVGHVLAQAGLNPVPGDTYSFPTEHPLADDNSQTTPEMVGFAFELYVDPRGDPECTMNTPVEHFSEDTPIGTSVGRISTSVIVDSSIPGYDFSLTSTGGLSLVVDTTTGIITTSGNLTSTPPSSQTFTLSGRTTEQVCLKFGSCTGSIIVDFVNRPISISNLPATSKLIESTTAFTKMATIETYDMNRNAGIDNTPKCFIAATSPFSAPFTLTANVIKTKFDLNYDATKSFDYDLVKSFLIIIICADDYGSSASGTYTLSINDNYGPVVTNKTDSAGKICSSVDARTTNNLDTVLNLDITDAETDKIITAFGTREKFSPFAWNSNTHEISATQDLLAIEIDQFNFYVDVSDKWNRKVRYFPCVNVYGLNDKPVLNNCPQNIQLPESSAIGTNVFTAGTTDSNYARDNQQNVFSMTVNPNSYASAFTLNTKSGAITVSQTSGIDYEKYLSDLKGKSIDFTINVTDGIHPALRDCEISVYITDVNEQPLFVEHTFNLTMNEEETVPYPLSSVNLTVLDADVADLHRHTYNILTSTDPDGYFLIDKKTGEITLEKRCDCDSGCPRSFQLKVEVTDPRGLTDLCTIYIDVNDINDNSPTFQTQLYHVDSLTNQRAGETLLTVTATDPDSGQNGKFTYFMAGIGYGSNNFAVDSSGNVTFTKPIDSEDASFTITICARDYGSPSRRGCTNAVIAYSSVSTISPDTSTKEGPCLVCTGSGVAIVTLLALCGVLILAFLMYLLANCIFRRAMYRMGNFRRFGRKPIRLIPERKSVQRPRMQNVVTRALPQRPVPPSGQWEVLRPM